MIEQAPKAGWQFWLIAIAAFIFNAGGAYNYLMMQTGNEAYRAMLSAEELAYYDAYPTWMEAAWGIGVWFAILGAILLLLRKKLAAPVFLVALLGYLAASVYTYILSDMPDSMKALGPTIFGIVIGLQLLGLWLYSRAMATKGVLK